MVITWVYKTGTECQGGRVRWSGFERTSGGEAAREAAAGDARCDRRMRKDFRSKRQRQTRGSDDTHTRGP